MKLTNVEGAAGDEQAAIQRVAECAGANAALTNDTPPVGLEQPNQLRRRTSSALSRPRYVAATGDLLRSRRTVAPRNVDRLRKGGW